MNISIVGCGSWADYTHMPCIIKYKQTNKINVISCADINIKSAKSMAEKYNIPNYFADYNEMLKKTNPDAVICLVSPNALAGVASDILRGGYPVMLEKPPGKTAEETKMIYEAAKKSGKPHMVAFNRRFAPVYLRLKELMTENGDNNIKYINYKFYRINRHESNFEDTAIHAIDAVKFLADSDFKRVEIKYQEMPGLGKNVANYYIYFEFINGIHAVAEMLVSTWELSEGCEIHAEKGVYRASLPMGTTGITGIGIESGGIVYKNSDRVCQTIEKSGICPHDDHYISQGFYNEHKHFYECLANGTNPGNGAETAIQSVMACQALKNRESFLAF